MTGDYYDAIFRQRGVQAAFAVAADDARKRLKAMGDLEAENHRLLGRIEELERMMREHRCEIPASIQEALNSGDGSYHWAI